MGITTSLVLIAVGAILTYAVDVTTEGFNLDTIGIILMIVGALGALLSLAFWSSWGGFDRRGVAVDDGVTRRRVVHDEIV